MKIYSILATALTVTLMTTMTTAMTAGDRGRVVINPEQRFQTIEFFGAADAWSGNFVGKYWSEDRKEEVADYLFSLGFDRAGNPDGIGLTMWRVNLGAGTLEDPKSDIFPYHRRAESYKTLDGKGFDWGKCSGHEYFMSAAVQRGCNNFTLFSNSPLVSHTLNGKGYSDFAGRANIKEDCYDDYADYLVEVAGHMIDKGYNISYISPINEPQVDWVNPVQEGTPWRNSEIYRMAKALDASMCRSRKMKDVRIFIAETSKLKFLYEHRPSTLERFGNDTLEAPGKQLYTFFDKSSPYYLGSLRHLDNEFTAHVYHDHFTSADLREVHRRAGREVAKYGLDYHSSEWCLLPTQRHYEGMTEDWDRGNYADMQAALMMGRLIHSDFVDANAVSWCYWKGMEINGNHSLVRLDPKDGDIHKGGSVSANKMLWALGNFSRFIRPGYVRVDLQGADDLNSLAATAFISPDSSELVVVFVNSSFDRHEVDFALPDDFRNRIRKSTVYLTDERHDLTKTLSYGSVSGSAAQGISYDIEARSVTTVILNLEN